MKGTITPRGERFVARYHVEKTRKWIWKTLPTYRAAEKFLAHCVVAESEGSLDALDYAKDNPLSIGQLSKTYLDLQSKKIRCIRNPRNHLAYAQKYLGADRNVKEIGFAEIEDFQVWLSLQVSAKGTVLSSKHQANILTTLHAFLRWCLKRKYIKEFPEWPEITFSLGWRKTVDQQTQWAILEELKRISWKVNPRIWFQAFLLSAFPKVRPAEINGVNEGDIDRQTGEVWVRHTKEGQEKRIWLLDEDLTFIQGLPRAFPEMPFFRHERRKGVSDAHRLKYSGRFGKDYVYKWWKRASSNLGIDVDLYGGTKHSTVTAARKRLSPEEIRRYVTDHKSNTAFDRYLHVDAETQREASRTIRFDPAHMLHISEGGVERKKVVNLQPDMVRKAGLEPAGDTKKK